MLLSQIYCNYIVCCLLVVFLLYSSPKSNIEDYNLYVVQPSVNDLFLNKTYNLCYGLFLKQVINTNNINIISYKEPFNLKDVNYDNIIEELYNENISDDENTHNGTLRVIGVWWVLFFISYYNFSVGITSFCVPF